MTLKKVYLYIRAKQKVNKQDYKMQATIAYKSAYATAFFTNDPKKAPEIEKLFPNLFDEQRSDNEKLLDYIQRYNK